MKIAIIAEDFAVGSPAQQLRDRLKSGYTRDGLWRSASHEIVDAPADADGIIVFQPSRLTDALNTAREGTAVFVYGTLAPTKTAAIDARNLAAKRKLPLCAGSVGSVLLQLPALKKAPISDAFIAAPAGSELLAIDGLLAAIDPKLPKDWNTRIITDEDVWKRRDVKWSGELLEAALSRSDKILGSTELDGRTEKPNPEAMAKKPRMAVFEPKEKWRAAFFVSEGLLDDIVLAVRTRNGIQSTQLFQAPSPQQEHFSRLAAAIEDFFASRTPPWAIDRAIVAAVIAEYFPGLRPPPKLN